MCSLNYHFHPLFVYRFSVSTFMRATAIYTAAGILKKDTHMSSLAQRIYAKHSHMRVCVVVYAKKDLIRNNQT